MHFLNFLLVLSNTAAVKQCRTYCWGVGSLIWSLRLWHISIVTFTSCTCTVSVWQLLKAHTGVWLKWVMWVTNPHLKLESPSMVFPTLRTYHNKLPRELKIHENHWVAWSPSWMLMGKLSASQTPCWWRGLAASSLKTLSLTLTPPPAALFSVAWLLLTLLPPIPIQFCFWHYW